MNADSKQSRPECKARESMESQAQKKERVCIECWKSIPLGKEVPLVKNNKSKLAEVSVVHPECMAQLKKNALEETQNVNYIFAAWLGFAAAFACMLAWSAIVAITQRQIAILAVLVGATIAEAVKFGAGKKRHFHLQLLSTGLTFSAMVASEVIIVVAMLFMKGYSVNFSSPMAVPAILLASLTSDPLTLLFWLIAIVAAFILPQPREILHIRRGPPKAGL